MNAVVERVPRSALPASFPDPSALSRRAEVRQTLAIVIAAVSGSAAVVTAVIGLIVLGR